VARLPGWWLFEVSFRHQDDGAATLFTSSAAGPKKAAKTQEQDAEKDGPADS